MKKILTVVGARPQFIKAAVVSRAIDEVDGLSEVLIHTGQHFDANMSDLFFKELDIRSPDYNLGVGGGTHGQNTGRMLEKIEAVMLTEKPDSVLVYGDTDSTLAGALAASKLNIPVAHVEAGLRSFNRCMPEEINRVITDHLSSVLFAPTHAAVGHLANEGLTNERVQVVGDVMYDAALHYKAHAKPPEDNAVRSLKSRSFVLCTVHRAENTDKFERMEGILAGLAMSPYPVVLPIHPRTRSRLDQMSLDMPANVIVIDPVGYLEMVWLEINSKLIITDSGGVQKEAYFHSRPCITMRDETEWMELVDMGVNRLVGVDPKRIIEALSADWSKIAFTDSSVYGSGKSGQLIAKYLMDNL